MVCIAISSVPIYNAFSGCALLLARALERWGLAAGCANTSPHHVCCLMSMACCAAFCCISGTL